jgi:hypothetical protein
MYLPDMLVPFDKTTLLHFQDVWLQVICAMFVCPSSWHIVISTNQCSDMAEEV